MSNNNGFNRERAATVLVEAAYTDDEKAAEKWGVTRVSIWGWRKRLATDPQLLTLFNYKKEQFEAEWAQDLPLAIKAGIDFLKRAAQQSDVKKPDVIYSIAGGLKILADIQTTKELLDARLAELSRSNNAEDRSLASTSDTGDTAPGAA